MTERAPRWTSLRARVLAVLLVITGTLVVGLYVPLRSVLLETFLQLEDDAVYRDLERARNAVRNELVMLHTTTRDYGQWDEAYRFVAGEHPQFAELNFPVKTFQDLKLSFVAIVDLTGKQHWSLGYDPVNAALGPGPQIGRAHV